MKVPCEKCGSSDGCEVYEDHTYCFVCTNREWTDGEDETQTDRTEPVGSPTRDIPTGIPQPLKARSIHQETCEKWGYLCSGDAQIAVYRDPKTRQPIGAKVRKAGKKFHTVGELSCLYGEWLWPSGQRMLTIVEGEIDALSVSQAQGNKFPVVSIPTGANSAVGALERSYEWVSSFERINVWFDNDEPGQKAARQVCEMLPPGKAHLVKATDLKDANEYLKAGRTKDIVDAIWRAEPFRPDGIVSGSDISLASIREGSVRGYSIPYPGLDAKLHGVRKRELTLLTAGSGIGKSTLAREMAYHLHQKHGMTIGNVFLEESSTKTAQGFIAIHNSVPLGNLREKPDIIDQGAWERSLREVVQERMYFYEHFGSLDSSNLLSKLRYLAVGCHCDFIVLDHISIVISGQEGSGEGERKDIDRLMTDLRSLVENTGVGIIAIVHLSKPQGTAHEEGGRVTLSHLRGSGSLKQLSDNVIAMERDQQGDNSDEALIRLLKCREFGELGECDTVSYSRETGRLLPTEASPF